MKLDVNLKNPSLDRAGGLAQTAEQMGFDGAWVTEMTHSPFTLTSLMGRDTTTIDIGTAIAVAFNRSPTVAAYAAWDVQSITEGRFILGLGTQVKGHIERRFGMNWESPGPRLREYVQALREIWDAWSENREPKFKGEFYTITLTPPNAIPDPPENPHVPIFVAGVNPFNIRLAGEYCDGLHIHPFHSPEYIEQEVIPYLEDGATRGGRSIDDVTLTTSVMAIPGNTPEERSKRREEVRSEIAFYASTRTYQKVLEVHGWEGVVDDLHKLSTRGQWNDMGKLVTDAMIDTFSIEGEWKELNEKINKRYDYIDRVALYVPYRGENHWREFI